MTKAIKSKFSLLAVLLASSVPVSPMMKVVISSHFRKISSSMWGSYQMRLKQYFQASIGFWVNFGFNLLFLRHILIFLNYKRNDHSRIFSYKINRIKTKRSPQTPTSVSGSHWRRVLSGPFWCIRWHIHRSISYTSRKTCADSVFLLLFILLG